MAANSLQQTFNLALDGLVDQIRRDRSILAALLCGSLSHDTVWARSDIDLVLVTIDDKKVEASDLCLYADGVNVHTTLFPRSEFRKLVEGSAHNSLTHSYLTKGRLLYSHDESISALCATMSALGSRDARLQLLRAGASVVWAIYKARKWFITRRDLDYTALWILEAATALAKIEIISAGQVVDREAIPQALKLNPSLFKTVYSDLLNTPKAGADVETALATVDRYLAERAPTLFQPILEHLREVGEARACREIEDHFARRFDVEGVTMACEYLADEGVIGKASTQARLTRKSNVEVQELAFFSLDGPPAARD
jgi:hypothetical protein